MKTVRPMISDLNTFLHKAVPDTRLTVKKYLDAKFEYLVSWNLNLLLSSCAIYIYIIQCVWKVVQYPGYEKMKNNIYYMFLSNVFLNKNTLMGNNLHILILWVLFASIKALIIITYLSAFYLSRGLTMLRDFWTSCIHNIHR